MNTFNIYKDPDTGMYRMGINKGEYNLWTADELREVVHCILNALHEDEDKELMRGPVLVTTCNGISNEDKQRIINIVDSQ